MDSGSRPSGTLTFLVTDIEQSTRRWEEQPDAMRQALARHDAVLRKAVQGHGGRLFKHTGDGVLAAFPVARSALDAAIDAQRKLELPVRMGICTGEAEARADDYYGPPLNRAARIMASSHAGQIVVAEATAMIIGGASLIDLGEHHLRDLGRPIRLYQVRAEGLKETFPPLKSLSALSGNLPAQTNPLIGREKEAQDTAAFLSDFRIVTLSGVGGVGKTRLAIEVGWRAAANYPDGVWLIELAGLRDPAAIAHATTAALNLSPPPGQTVEQGLLTLLAGRKLLLIFDNCEHLVEAVASLMRQIAAQCPQTTILATSREPLMIQGERNYPVDPLAIRMGDASPAAELFIDRARAIGAEIDLTRDGGTIAEICRKLDGLPLAIELAAARSRTMSPAQIRDNLGARYRLLTAGKRDAIERHRTLRHAIQWSYDLLSAPEQTLLARTSVFAGGFTLEAAESVCAGGDVETFDVLDLLDALVHKSLLTVERSGASMRYGTLETIRQFAEERLAATGGDADRRLCHAEFFARNSDAFFEVWRSPRQSEAYDWLNREMDNLRYAFQWARRYARTDAAARIASNVGDMARFHLRDEAGSWPEEILDAARKERHPRLSVLLTWAASVCWSVGRLDDGQRFGAEALTLVDDPDFYPFVWAYTDLAFIALIRGDPVLAVELARRGAECETDRRDRMCLATLLYLLALVGRNEEARAMAEQAVVSVEAAGVPCAVVVAWVGRGEALAGTDPAGARAAYERAAEIARRTGNRLFVGVATPKIAEILVRLGDPKAALRGFRDMLQPFAASLDVAFLSAALGNLIVLFERLGEPVAAATLYGALSHVGGSDAFVPELVTADSRLRQELGEPGYRAARSRGEAMSAADAEAFAIAEIFRLDAEGPQDVSDQSLSSP